MQGLTYRGSLSMGVSGSLSSILMIGGLYSILSRRFMGDRAYWVRGGALFLNG
jgi:hypothetical protein